MVQFSDTTNYLGIIQACERYTNLGNATISGTAATLKEFTAYANEAMRSTWHAIFTSYGGWQYEDSNQTDMPVATTTLTSGQTSYPIPSDALTVKGVEVKNSGSVWSQLYPITEEMIRQRDAESQFLSTSGTPQYYRLVGPTIYIYPASNWTQAASLKVYFDRGSVAFASTDTTKTPGFASEYHDLIPLDAAVKWLEIKRPNDASLANLRADRDKKLKDLKDFYSMQLRQMFPPRLRVQDQLSEAR